MLPEQATALRPPRAPAYTLTAQGGAALALADLAELLVLEASAAQAWRRLMALADGVYGEPGAWALDAQRVIWQDAERALAALLEGGAPCKP